LIIHKVWLFQIHHLLKWKILYFIKTKKSITFSNSKIIVFNCSFVEIGFNLIVSKEKAKTTIQNCSFDSNCSKSHLIYFDNSQNGLISYCNFFQNSDNSIYGDNHNEFQVESCYFSKEQNYNIHLNSSIVNIICSTFNETNSTSINLNKFSKLNVYSSIFEQYSNCVDSYSNSEATIKNNEFVKSKKYSIFCDSNAQTLVTLNGCKFIDPGKFSLWNLCGTIKISSSNFIHFQVSIPIVNPNSKEIFILKLYQYNLLEI
jgi:hypothetical protein